MSPDSGGGNTGFRCASGSALNADGREIAIEGLDDGAEGMNQEKLQQVSDTSQNQGRQVFRWLYDCACCPLLSLPPPLFFPWAPACPCQCPPFWAVSHYQVVAEGGVEALTAYLANMGQSNAKVLTPAEIKKRQEEGKSILGDEL